MADEPAGRRPCSSTSLSRSHPRGTGSPAAAAPPRAAGASAGVYALYVPPYVPSPPAPACAKWRPAYPSSASPAASVSVSDVAGTEAGIAIEPPERSSAPAAETEAARPAPAAHSAGYVAPWTGSERAIATAVSESARAETGTGGAASVIGTIRAAAAFALDDLSMTAPPLYSSVVPGATAVEVPRPLTSRAISSATARAEVIVEPRRCHLEASKAPGARRTSSLKSARTSPALTRRAPRRRGASVSAPAGPAAARSRPTASTSAPALCGASAGGERSIRNPRRPACGGTIGIVVEVAGTAWVGGAGAHVTVPARGSAALIRRVCAGPATQSPASGASLPGSR